MIDIDFEKYGRYLMFSRHYSDLICKRDISFIQTHLQSYTREDILQATDIRRIVEAVTGRRYSSGNNMSRTYVSVITHLQDYLRREAAA